MTTPEREPLISEQRVSEMVDQFMADTSDIDMPLGKIREECSELIRQACRETAEACVQLALEMRDAAGNTTPDESQTITGSDHLLGQGWALNLFAKRVQAAIRAKVGRE